MAFDAAGLKKSSMQETENAFESLFSKSEIRGCMAFVAPKNLAYVSAFSVCNAIFGRSYLGAHVDGFQANLAYVSGLHGHFLKKCGLK